MKFIRTPAQGLIYDKPSFQGCEDLSELFDHVVAVFSHVLPCGKEFTAQEFAEKIKETYSIEVLRNKVVYDFMCSLDDMMFAYRSRSGDKLVIAGIPRSNLNERIYSKYKNELYPGELVSLSDLNLRLQ